MDSSNQSFTKKHIVICIVLWTLTAALMAAIFWFSSQEADDSSETSGDFIEAFLTAFYRDFKQMDQADRDEIVKSMQYVVRTAAHLSEFIVLGALMCAAAHATWRSGRKTAWIVFSVCVLYAVSDEVHQLFVKGRTFQWTDIAVDFVGSLAGVILSHAAVLRLSRRRGRGSGKESRE